MLIYADIERQLMKSQLGSGSGVNSLIIPRDAAVEIAIKFDLDGVIYGPDDRLVNTTLQIGRRYKIITMASAPSSVTISSVTEGNPTTFVTSTNHGLTTGDIVTIAGVTVLAPSVNGNHEVTVTALNAFTIAVTTTGTASLSTPTATKVADDFTGAGAGSNADGVIFIATNDDPPWQCGTIIQRCNAAGDTTLGLRWTVKSKDKYDQDPPLAMSASFSKYGTGTEAVYIAHVDYTGVSLNASLGVNPPTDTDDIAFIDVLAELAWSGPVNGKTLIVTNRVTNDLFKGTELPPVLDTESPPPATDSDGGVAGHMIFSGGYLYICNESGDWYRFTGAKWS